jgi:hypothetical protein
METSLAGQALFLSGSVRIARGARTQERQAKTTTKFRFPLLTDHQSPVKIP